MPRMSVYQDHQIIGESSILDVGVLAVARGLLRPLQHPIYLCKIDITEQRRDDPALRNASFPLAFSPPNSTHVLWPLGNNSTGTGAPSLAAIVAGTNSW